MGQKGSQGRSDKFGDDEEDFLDEVFERALSGIEEGASPSIDELLDGREASRARVQELLILAKEVALSEVDPADHPTVAGYALERELGAGAMGTVYLARQTALGGRRVALKILPRSLQLSVQAKARFLSEARALARVSREGVVTIHEIVEQDGVVAFSMDWIEGGALARVLAAWRNADEASELDITARVTGIERSRLGSSAILWVVREFAALAHALQFVHENGLLHRDLKPANVLIAHSGRFLLSDFGLVRGMDSARFTTTGQFVGTPAYSAPEQLRGEVHAIDVRSDVYGLGATLYEALTLHPPYEGRTSSELLARIESGAYTPPRRRGVRLPRDLETILSKALDLEPARRYVSASGLAEDLERLLAFRPIHARPARMSERATRFLRRHRAVARTACVATLLVAALACMGARWWLERQRAGEEAYKLLNEARIALLDPNITDVLFVSGLGKVGMERGATDNLVPLVAVVRAAVEKYEAALAWRPPEALAREIDLERSAVEAALALERGERPDLNARFVQACPLSTAWIERWSTGSREPFVLPEGPLDRVDRRYLGLLLLLMRQPQAALAAWQNIAEALPVDAFADALQGEYFRVIGEPERAFALLRMACDRFPLVGFLRARLADVALLTGRDAMAEQLLEGIESLPYPDPHQTEQRVRTDLLAVRGEDAEALAGYIDLAKHRRASSAFLHFAHFLESRGELSKALWQMDVLNTIHPGFPRHELELVRVGERWWASTSEAPWKKLLNALDDVELPVGPLPAFLRRYREVARRHSEVPEFPVLPSPFSGRMAQAPVRPAEMSLANIATREEIDRIDMRLWPHLPRALRAVHSWALCQEGAEWLGLLLRGLEGSLGDRLCREPRMVVGPAATSVWPSINGGPDNRRRALGLQSIEGRLLWERGCSGTPAVGEGIVVLRQTNDDTSELCGVDLETGAVLWDRQEVGQSDFLGPVVFGNYFLFPLGTRGRHSAATGQEERVECRRLLDGALRWTCYFATDSGPHPLQVLPGTGGSWVVSMSTAQVVVETGGWINPCRTRVLDPRAGNGYQAMLWEEPENSRQAIGMPATRQNARDSSEVWTHRVGGPQGASSVELRGVVLTPGSFEVAREIRFPLSGDPWLPRKEGVSYGPSEYPVIDREHSRVYLVDRGGWLFGYDLETERPLWPARRVTATCDIAVCTVMDDGRIVVVDPSVPILTKVDPISGEVSTIELDSPPMLGGFLVGDHDRLWVLTRGGGLWVCSIGAGGLDHVLDAPGGTELCWGGGAFLVRCGNQLAAYR